MQLHNTGRGARYVRSRRPAILVYAKPYRYFLRVVKEERRLKRLTRRQKDALITGGRESACRARMPPR